jgi:hypothetical protein
MDQNGPKHGGQMPDEAPFTMSVPAAGKRYLGLGRNASYEAAKRGDLPVVEVGRLKRVLVRVLEDRLSRPFSTDLARQATTK